ncbi:uncharacterized protein LOC132038031 [Lycium ferocissimum]|uniref:uncharacterized protein LOC132038031 n=1 Tax=Lycium ferocissimum TaxID=112874 RepID=UPI0028151E3E|nr:uncharacterized protein LOC132038031 [Lycium ferocissimum]
MEFLHKAKYVRLKSHHMKFLHANSDQKNVFQHRHRTSKTAKWTVEFPEGVDNVVRFKSCYGKYLMATDEQFLLGVTGLKVVQNLPIKLDSSIEWEPIKVESSLVKLKTSYGKYLRANGGLPPFRNSITHDVPYRHQDWILWEVDIIELLPEPPKNISQPESLHDDLESPKNISQSKSLRDDLEPPKSISQSRSLHDNVEAPKSVPQQPESLDDDLNSSFRLTFSRRSSNIEPRVDASKSKSEGRVIYYYVADEIGNVNDTVEGPSFQFKNQGLKELTQKLEEETGLNNVTLCLRNKLNGKLYPLRLELPPINATMHVVVMPASSKG